MPEPLTQEETRQLEATLREERKVLLDALDERLHQGDDPDEMSLKNNIQDGAPDDRPSASMLNDEAIAEVSLELRELRAVEAALERIAQGSYGICANCSSPIGVERMRAQPAAALCIACQTESERHPSLFAPNTSRMRL
ncbi:MAG TPA: TraR/DksA family transcriptional regulator [Telluria sp.]|nr:TraR/DksA family transcriptional regulator [Telluria sp.]